MSAITAMPSRTGTDVERDAERSLRVDLAVAFRVAARNGWHESVANHFSVAVSPDGGTFLVNPRWKHFSRIRASDLLRLEASDPDALARPDAPDPSAFMIHGAIHARVPHARCVLHCHPPYGTAVAALADPTILPIDQNTARFFNRVAIDRDYGGIADNEAEGERLASALGNRRVLMMGNHGVLVVGQSVAEALDLLYYLERACRTLVLAYSTGRPLAVLSDETAEHTAAGWEDYPGYADAYLSEMRALLDARGADYAQ
jgi:ribulose-5-phosphate 4-epimerase/fuculose-1-phosphate aldolase